MGPNGEEKFMTKHGLMPHNDRYPFFSRDWQDIDCKSISCQNNRGGKCTIPSKATIGVDGRCEGFSVKLDKTPKP